MVMATMSSSAFWPGGPGDRGWLSTLFNLPFDPSYDAHSPSVIAEAPNRPLRVARLILIIVLGIKLSNSVVSGLDEGLPDADQGRVKAEEAAPAEGPAL